MKIVRSLAVGLPLAAAAVMPMVAGAAESEGAASPADVVREFAGDVKSRAVTYASALAQFREMACDRPCDASTLEFFFSPNATSEWSRVVGGELRLTRLVQADFFTGSIPLSGSSTRKGCIAGLYNPWWDVVLLLSMHVEAVHPVVPNGVSPAVLIDGFRWVSGETFRGEPPGTGDVRHVTVVPEGEPLSAEVWRVTAATVRRFEEVYPVDAEGLRTLSFRACGDAVASPDMRLESLRISARAGLRLKLSLGLLKNAQALGIGMHVQRMARNGSLFQLYSYFREPESRKLLQQFNELPDELRKDFVLYGYVPTREATLYVLVNKKFSRLYVTATVPADVPKTPASFEWYDLDRAGEMLELWNNRAEKKEVSK